MNSDKQASEAASDLQRVFALQRAAHLADPYPSEAVRRDRLERLLAMIKDNSAAIEDTICADYGHRSKDETMGFEILNCVLDVRHTLKLFPKWMKTERRPVALTSFPGRAEIVKQPLGVVGVVVPWNYPLFLAITPISAALAAGNRVMVKMSADTPSFSALFAEMVARTFKPEEMSAVTGGGRAFTSLPFDHILYTGSSATGKQVMQQASANLTPVTLELGGKSPTIIADDASLEYAVKHILFGKLVNSGQTCIAPDYVMVPRKLEKDFLAMAKQVVENFYPTLQDNPDYSCVVNDKQAQRLRRYIADAKEQGAEIFPLHSETIPESSRKFTPLAITKVKDSMLVVQEEIFGPLLPVIVYDHFDEVIDYINARPRPLALYLFTNDSERQEKVLRHTTSGGAVINDVMLQVLQNDLPFGGVGQSGMGHYHGKEGFDTFSKLKGVFRQSRINGASLAFPPRTNGRLRRMAEFLIR
ncbi:MAG: coniferyl aldehyde dehydrogenase [Sterolibacterium sp.]|nr:coniferyl aldehyde dehydrogenase [Sterolibacterium sp.]